MKLVSWMDRNGAWWIASCVAVGLVVMTLSSGPVACTPAQTADITKVEQTILQDLENGVALQDIEAAILLLVPQGADVDVIINDAITFLHDMGLIPPNVLPKAFEMQGKIAVKLQDRGVK